MGREFRTRTVSVKLFDEKGQKHTLFSCNNFKAQQQQDEEEQTTNNFDNIYNAVLTATRGRNQNESKRAPRRHMDVKKFKKFKKMYATTTNIIKNTFYICV